MSLLDFFKKKKEKPAKKIKKKEEGKIKEKEKKEEVFPVSEKKKTEKSKEKEIKTKSPRKKVLGELSDILIFPHITEKSTRLSQEGKYIFKVLKKANKSEIKKAVEKIYNVEVLNVNIINIPRKKRRIGRQEGWRKGYKKAIIKLKKGQKIELLPR